MFSSIGLILSSHVVCDLMSAFLVVAAIFDPLYPPAYPYGCSCCPCCLLCVDIGLFLCLKDHTIYFHLVGVWWCLLPFSLYQIWICRLSRNIVIGLPCLQFWLGDITCDPTAWMVPNAICQAFV